MTTRQILDRHRTEIECVLRDHRIGANGVSDEDALALKRKENAILLDMLQQQKRVLDFLAGEKIEPQVHYAQGVMVGVFGGGT